MVVTAALVIAVNMVVDLVIKDISVPDYGLPARYTVTLNWFYVALCVYLMYSSFEIIYTRRLQMNMAAIERLRASEARQYAMSRENIEAINIKCHDIRHQIRHLADGGTAVDRSVLSDIAREINVYDSVVETGNEALDTILTEKSLACSGEGIVLTVMADGSALDFMTPADVYALFGNALDNAIEAVRGVDDEERRTITLSVRRLKRMVAVSVENYYSGVTRFSDDGLPITSKRDRSNHGFGVRSMRAIAERYGGSLHAGVQDGVFYLNVLLAMPETPAST